jgi:hypothetical protein
MPSIDVCHFNVTMKLGEAVDCASEFCQRILLARLYFQPTFIRGPQTTAR